ncbi:hypothetical protein EMIT0194MI4_770007 [Pseudomonas sp. IT-194MI4]
MRCWRSSSNQRSSAPIQFQKLFGQCLHTATIGPVRSPVVVHIRAQHPLKNPIVIQIADRSLVGNPRSVMKMQSYRLRRTVSGWILREDAQVPLLSFIRVIPGAFQVRFAKRLELLTIRVRRLALQLFTFKELENDGICRALPASILCNNFQKMHPCAPLRKGQIDASTRVDP